MTIRGFATAGSPMPKPPSDTGPVGNLDHVTTVQPEGTHGPEFHHKTVNTDVPDLRGCEKVRDEHGFPSVRGVPMMTDETSTDRALRLTSDRCSAGRVLKGYIVGRDQRVYEDGTRVLLMYLDDKLGQYRRRLCHQRRENDEVSP